MSEPVEVEVKSGAMVVTAKLNIPLEEIILLLKPHAIPKEPNQYSSDNIPNCLK